VEDLIKQLTTKEVLESKIQNLLIEASDRFMDNILTYACKLAKHRGSETLDVGDVKFAFEKLANVNIPAADNVQGQPGTFSQPASTSNYLSNLSMIKKEKDQAQN
jgi:transcription initiation factor TFIID subunit 12